MNFPNVPHSWDFGPFLLGCFFIFLGFYWSDRWAFFFGILLLEFGLSIFSFGIIGVAFHWDRASERQQSDYFLFYFIAVAIILLITAFILGKVYFDFDIRLVIKEIYFNHTSDKSNTFIDDAFNKTSTWIQNITH